jgi:hypothetical protein
MNIERRRLNDEVSEPPFGLHDSSFDIRHSLWLLQANRRTFSRGLPALPLGRSGVGKYSRTAERSNCRTVFRDLAEPPNPQPPNPFAILTQQLKNSIDSITLPQPNCRPFLLADQSGVSALVAADRHRITGPPRLIIINKERLFSARCGVPGHESLPSHG